MKKKYLKLDLQKTHGGKQQVLFQALLSSCKAQFRICSALPKLQDPGPARMCPTRFIPGFTAGSRAFKYVHNTKVLMVGMFSN